MTVKRTREQLSNEIVDREVLQAYIKKTYPEKLEKNKKLCRTCSVGNADGSCRSKVLPVTSTGNNCPYWQTLK